VEGADVTINLTRNPDGEVTLSFAAGTESEERDLKTAVLAGFERIGDGTYCTFDYEEVLAKLEELGYGGEAPI
jgi:hypothetical protein